MTIDERLEALTQTVELLAAMHRDSEKRFEQFERNFEQSQRKFEQKSEQFEQKFELSERDFEHSESMFVQVGRNFEVVLDSIRGLENIARSHDQRLDHLEE